MFKVGKYYFDEDNLLLASKAASYLNRRRSVEESGIVVVSGRRIEFRLNCPEQNFAADAVGPVAATSRKKLAVLA